MDYGNPQYFCYQEHQKNSPYSQILKYYTMRSIRDPSIIHYPGHIIWAVSIYGLASCLIRRSQESVTLDIQASAVDIRDEFGILSSEYQPQFPSRLQ